MDLFVEGIREAWRLLTTGEGGVYSITLRTLAISGTTTLIALLIGLPAGMAVALARFPGQRTIAALSNAGMGMPPVVAGLIIATLLWRSGPLGALGWIYTPTAMVMAQALIATPVVAAITAAGLMALPPSLHLQIRAMGAGNVQYLWLLSREARLPLLVAVMAGFGAAVSEVGASIMVGGNLAGETRVLTTATVLEVSRGNFGTAHALGFLLLAIVVVVGVVVTVAQERARRR